MECIFCHKEKLVTDIVYEDEIVMAFMDMDPINEGHIFPRYQGDEFGWTYGDEPKKVNAEIAGRIRDGIN